MDTFIVTVQGETLRDLQSRTDAEIEKLFGKHVVSGVVQWRSAGMQISSVMHGPDGRTLLYEATTTAILTSGADRDEQLRG